MNKNEEFIQKIVKDTKNGNVKWKLVEIEDYASFITNPKWVIRALKAELNNIDVFIFESKTHQYDPDHDFSYQYTEYFAIIRKDNVTARELYENTVDRDYLAALLAVAVDQVTNIDDDIEEYLSPR